MNFLVAIQTLIAVIIVCIALWVAFHLLKVLIPYKKVVVILLISLVVGLVVYDRNYKNYKVEKDSNDESQIYINTYDSLYSIDEDLTYNNENTVYSEDINNCVGLPQYCYQMINCNQAIEAFECGNYELDGDSDGVPCESICGSY